MSAASPVTAGETSARNWAESRDLSPAAIVGVVMNLREELEVQVRRASEAGEIWRKLRDQAETTMYRIEALKHKLVTEL